MNYKKVIAYNPDTSVLFELDNGNFALVSVGEDEEAENLITVSEYAESFLKFGGFEDAKDIPKETLEEAVDILKKGKQVFTFKKAKLK